MCKMSINRVVISGNLTRDPDIKLTQGGTPVLSLGVAVNDRRRNPQTGEWEDVPNFVDCVMFGSRAQAVSRFLTKGLKVAIEGKLRYSSWERDGQRRNKLEVMIDEIEFMSSRNNQSMPRQDQGQYNQVPQQTQQEPYYASQAAPAVAPTQAVPPAAVPPASTSVPMQAPDAAYQQTQPVQDQGFATQTPPATPPSTDVYDQDIPF